MNTDSEKFLFDLLNTPSPSGTEQSAAKLFRERVKGYADKIERDVHGNTFAIVNPDAKFKFMITGHIDEIGLMITHIDEKGFLYVEQIGGMDPALLVGQRVKIMNARGDVLGVIGRKAIHLMEPDERTKPVKMDNIWVDIGASSRKDAGKYVAVGDSVVIDVVTRKLKNNMIIARGIDDRAGAYIVAEVVRELAKKKPKICVIGVATVQEELGLRGAITSAYSAAPDAAIAVDVSFATDHPETSHKKTGEAALGKGAIIHRGPANNPVLQAELVKAAKALKVPYQITAAARRSGTDADAIQVSRGGVATAVVSIPNRYMHTPVEVISAKDMDNIVKLLAGFLAKHPAAMDYRP